MVSCPNTAGEGRRSGTDHPVGAGDEGLRARARGVQGVLCRRPRRGGGLSRCERGGEVRHHALAHGVRAALVGAGAHRRARLLCRSGPHTALGGLSAGRAGLSLRPYRQGVPRFRGGDARRARSSSARRADGVLRARSLCPHSLYVEGDEAKARHRGGFHGSARCAAAR